jgi:hypothetical protein
MLKWSNADYMLNNMTTAKPTSLITKGPNKGKPQPRPDRGRLPAQIPEPVFVADPNHRKKVLTGELYTLANAVVSQRFTMTKNDTARIGKNFGYMIRSLHKLDGNEDKMIAAGKSILEHQFDNHEFCGAWCPRKRMTPQQLVSSERFYRCKEKDSKLYSVLVDKVSRFTSLDRLQECAHRMDTQVNESFNNTVAWMAPKNKVYCGSSSLGNRVGMAIGIKSLGLYEYFKRLFIKMGIHMTPNVVHYLHDVKERSRHKRLEKLKTKELKKERLQSRITKQKEYEVIAKNERKKRDGTYKSGQNVMGNGDDEEEQLQAQPPKKKSRKDLVCSSCGQRGHATTKARACTNYDGNRCPAAVQGTMNKASTVGALLTAADQAKDVLNFETAMHLEEEDPPSEADEEVLVIAQRSRNAQI